jgi:hypothetical protein
MSRFKDLCIISACLVLSVNYGWEVKKQIYYWRHQSDAAITLPMTFTQPESKAKPEQWTTRPPEVEPPEDHPPLTIIGGIGTFTVHYTTHEWLLANDSGAVTIWKAGNALGLQGLNNTIWMYRGDLTPRATLMHELFHVAKGLGDQQNWHNDDAAGQDHEFISNAAPELLLILRRNPKLVAWLMDGKPQMSE